MITNMIEGDVCKASEKMIVHGCNAQGVMGAGVAKAIRNTYPEAFADYMQVHKNLGLSLGSVVYSQSKGKIIANCIIQDGYGYDGRKYLSYDALHKCLDNVNKECRSQGITTIAMPMIGSGLAGGSWDVVKEIIFDRITFPAVTVYYML